MKRTVRTALLVGLLVVFGHGCGLDKELTVGVETGIRPLAYEERGQLKGFEVDLWKALAKEAGLKYRFKPMSAGDIIRAVEHKEIDVGLAALTITKERKKDAEFSIPYMTGGLRIMTRSGDTSVQSPNQLKNKVVATRIGTTGYRYASYVKGVREVRAYPDIEAAIQALRKGEVDAVLFDEPIARMYAAGERSGVGLSGRVLTKEQYGIMLTKGSPYTGRVNNALRELGKNGEYERIYIRWFRQMPDGIPGKKG